MGRPKAKERKKNMIQTIEKMISHQEQRQYIRVPIDILDNVQRIDIQYDYDHFQTLEKGNYTFREEINIVDFALEDENFNLLGATGSNKRSVFIKEDIATPGCFPTKIEKGTWYVMLGAYKIAPEGCKVTITVKQTLKERVLLKGDVHLHTQHSDGWYTVEELVTRAKQNRLDFIAVTDHNSMTSNTNNYSDENITVIPGIEVTYYNGHYNLLGQKKPIRTYYANNKEEVVSIMREGKASEALLILNHPKCPNCGWTFGFDQDIPYDGIEIWNGPFTGMDMEAILLWQELLSKGQKTIAIGGSDCHHEELFRNIGTPTLFVYAMSRNSSDILEAINKGNVFIGMTPDAPTIYLSTADAIMGETSKDSKLQVEVGKLSGNDEVRLIDETGVFHTLTPKACEKYAFKLPADNKKFIRVEIWRTIEGLGVTLASISNPIYFE